MHGWRVILNACNIIRTNFIAKYLYAFVFVAIHISACIYGGRAEATGFNLLASPIPFTATAAVPLTIPIVINLEVFGSGTTVQPLSAFTVDSTALTLNSANADNVIVNNYPTSGTTASTLSGSTNAILAQGKNLTVNNGNSSTSTVANSIGSGTTSGAAILCTASSGSSSTAILTLTNTGSSIIQNRSSSGSNGATIAATNTGKLSVINSGTITNNAAITAGLYNTNSVATADTLSLTSSGTLRGDLVMRTGSVTLTGGSLTGSIVGLVGIGPAAGPMTVSMSGGASISGDITFLSGVQALTFSNTSTGNVGGNINAGNGSVLNFSSTGSVIGNISGATTTTMNVKSGGSYTQGDGSVISITALNVTGTFTFNNSTTPVGSSILLTGTLTNTGTFNVEQNLSLAMAIQNSGNIALYSGKQLTTTGAVSFTGNAITDGAGQSGGAYQNAGTFTYNAPASPNGLTFSGLFTNSGTFIATTSISRPNSTTSSGPIQIANGQYFQNTGSMTQTAGTISSVSGTGTLINIGTYAMQGGNITALFQNLTPGVFNLSTTFAPKAASQNTGTMNVISGGVLNLSNQFANSGLIENKNTSGATTLSITAPITSSGTIQNDAGAQMSFGGGTAGNSNTINNFGTLLINGTATNNGSIVNKAGGIMTISASVNNGTGVTGSITNQGTAEVSATSDITNTISNQSTMTIDSGVTLTVDSPGSFTDTTTGTLNINGTLNGSGAQNIAGTVNVGSIATPGGALTGTGAFTLASTGIINLAGSFANTYSSFNNSGAIYILNGASTTNGLTGTTGSSLIVGKNSSGTVSNVNYTTTGVLNGIATYDIVGGSTFTAPFAIQNMSNNFLVESGATATIDGGLSGTGTVTNNGTFELDSVLNTGTVTNTGTFNMDAAADIASGVTVNTSGNFNFAVAGSTNDGIIVNTGTMTGAAAFTNSATGSITNNNVFNLNAPFTNNGAIVNNSAMTVGSGDDISGTGSITNGSAGILSLTNINNSNSITNNGGSINVSTALLGSGSVQNNSGYLNFSDVNLGNAVSNSGIMNIAGTLSGTGVITNNAAGSISVNSATLNQTNALVNNGNIYINGGSILSGPTVNNNTITLNPGATLTVSGTGSIPAGSVYGNGNGTTLVISNDFSTAATINGIKSIIISAGSTMRLQMGATVSNFTYFAINGDLFIGNGAIFNIGPGDNITGDGSLENNGSLNLNGSTLRLGGSFYNHTSGIFSIYGVPEIYFGGAFTNDGEIVATFNASNKLPIINIGGAPTLVNGTIAIGYAGNYIANGFYPFINAGVPLTAANVGNVVLPQPNFYITSWQLQERGDTVGVAVTRRGFGEVATTPEAQQIGAYLDTLGANSPSQAILNLLNGLSQITNPIELDAALIEILPPDNVPMQSLNMLEFIGAVQDHIFSLPFHNDGFFIPRNAIYCSGDANISNGLWVRPYGSSARQRDKGSLIGYTARTNGVVGGFDNQLADNLLLGMAGSYTKSTVTQATQLASITRIKNYQVMLYGSYRSDSNAYLDSVFSVGTNNYQGSRVMNITSFQAVADSRYSGQQLSAKVMGSKNYRLMRYYQFTPMATAQYSYVRQLPYQETNAGPFNRVVQPNNINLLQLGVGSQFSVPFDEGKITGIPAVYGMLLVDAQGGALVTNTQFISGGPILVNTVQAGRLAARLGMSMSFQVGDNVQVIGNYNIEMRSKYFCNEVFLNLRYIF